MARPVEASDLGAFFVYVVGVLEWLEVPYMVVGGFAAVAHGEPRFTADADIVIDMQPEQVDDFVAAFPALSYYVSDPDAIRESLARRTLFNVIQPTTGAKVDLIPLSDDPLHRALFEGRQRLVFDAEAGHAAFFLSAEGLIVSKLDAFRATRSERHLRDIRGVLTVQWGRLDLGYVEAWAERLGLGQEWRNLLDAARREASDEGTD
jgi:hypothetical protein